MNFCQDWSNDKEHRKLLETLKLVGALLGIIVFVWKVWESFSSFLRISLSVDLKDDETCSAWTHINNNSLLPKPIENAILLIGPENESPIETFNLISDSLNLGFKAKSTNCIAEFLSDKIHSDCEGRSLIPLSFYYSENIRISDEELSYRSPIDIKMIPVGVPYSVRFFIFASGRYHRSTHDCFVLNSRQAG